MPGLFVLVVPILGTVEHVEQRVLLGAGLCGGPVPG